MCLCAAPSDLVPSFTVEFTLDFIRDFDWNTEAYENLVIPADQKAILTTLVEAHSSGPASQIDDFVTGKGMGLVINLYGNPGTGTSHYVLMCREFKEFVKFAGKSLTAEAMSECQSRVLCVMSSTFTDSMTL